jgi:hypothetical protein
VALSAGPGIEDRRHVHGVVTLTMTPRAHHIEGFGVRVRGLGVRVQGEGFRV